MMIEKMILEQVLGEWKKDPLAHKRVLWKRARVRHMFKPRPGTQDRPFFETEIEAMQDRLKQISPYAYVQMFPEVER